MGFAMRRALNLPAFLFVVGAALLFSLMLMRLGIDMESPEILRYILIATVPLSLVVALALLSSRQRSWAGLGAAAMLLSAITCVPLESLAYVVSLWSLRNTTVFHPSNLPTLLGILFGWSVVVAVLAMTAASAIMGLRKLLVRGGQS